MLSRSVSYVVFLLLLGGYGIAMSHLVCNPIATDFSTFYHSAISHTHGLNIYQIDSIPLSVSTVLTLPPNLDPPFFNWLLLPMGHVTFYTAFRLWCGLIIFSVIIGVSLIRHFVMPKSVGLGWWITGLLVYQPMFLSFYLAQVTGILFLLMVLLWLSSRSELDVAAGIALGILCSIKLFFGLFVLFFLLQRRFLLLAVSAFVAGLAVMVTLHTYGWSIYQQYRNVLHNINWYTSSINASALGFFMRLFGGGELNHPYVNVPWLTHVFYVLTIVLIVGYMLLSLRRKTGIRKPQREFDSGFALTSVAMLIISPFGWSYYFPLLMIAMIIVFELRQFTPHPIGVTVASLFALFLSGIPTPILSPVFMSSRHLLWSVPSIYFYALIILLSMCVYCRYYVLKDDLVASNTTLSTIAPPTEHLLIFIALLSSIFVLIKVQWLLYFTGQV